MALPPSEVDAIRAAESVLAARLEDEDPTAWVDCYTDDAIFSGPGGRHIEGREAFLAAAPNIQISSMEIVADSTIGDGGFAATTGHATWLSGPKGSGTPTCRRFLMVWRKESDARWRIAREMVNEA